MKSKEIDRNNLKFLRKIQGIMSKGSYTHFYNPKAPRFQYRGNYHSFSNRSRLRYIMDKNKHILNWYSGGKDWDDAGLHGAKDFLDRYNVELICVDGSAQGNIVVQMVQSWFKNQGRNYRFKGEVMTDKYKDRVYKMLYYDAIEDEDSETPCTIKYPALSDNDHVETFERELLDLEKEMSSKGLWKIHHPKGNYHDDYPDSLVLALDALHKLENRPRMTVRSVR